MSRNTGSEVHTAHLNDVFPLSISEFSQILEGLLSSDFQGVGSSQLDSAAGDAAVSFVTNPLILSRSTRRMRDLSHRKRAQPDGQPTVRECSCKTRLYLAQFLGSECIIMNSRMSHRANAKMTQLRNPGRLLTD